MNAHDSIRAVSWHQGALRLLDQRCLPGHVEHLHLTQSTAVAEAITAMAVRGAPAIGIAAAYATVLAAGTRYAAQPDTWASAIEADLRELAQARPTAVNLAWALGRMRTVIDSTPGDPRAALLQAALALHGEDIAGNRRMGALGAALIEPGRAVRTYCNTGSLATGGYGTALGVIRSAYTGGRITQVYAAETRPWLQGARLTAWELAQDGIPVQLLADGAVAHLLRQGEVAWLIVGADRIAANGDVANKIGTYAAALAARHHGVRTMVVAPTATIDPATPNGAAIPIELRPPEEVLSLAGQRIAPPGACAWNPAFDITPAELIDALVTERGVIVNPNAERLIRHLSS